LGEVLSNGLFVIDRVGDESGSFRRWIRHAWVRLPRFGFEIDELVLRNINGIVSLSAQLRDEERGGKKREKIARRGIFQARRGILRSGLCLQLVADGTIDQLDRWLTVVFSAKRTTRLGTIASPRKGRGLFGRQRHNRCQESTNRSQSTDIARPKSSKTLGDPRGRSRGSSNP
jgi:hypothetical protein